MQFKEKFYALTGLQAPFYHQSNLEHNCMIKLAQIKPGIFFDLLQTVDKRVAVNEQPACRLRNIEAAFKKRLHGRKRFGVQNVFSAIAEHF